MSNLPDFSDYGYQVIRELGYNRVGGRVTYLAWSTSRGRKGELGGWKDGENDCHNRFVDDTSAISFEQEEAADVTVVIKQFQFAQVGASWAEYDAYEQEIRMLRQLKSPGIPRYLDSFQTPNGFCMVQEYKTAQALSEPQHFSPQEIKEIAIAVLEILVYLQSQEPCVIHRDIKPENLLIDKSDAKNSLDVYLIDFGFARLGGGEVAVSSVVKGTLGFMPPEQLFNRQLTQASDLYGLGVTLICLVTGTKSVDIVNFIDAEYRLHFQHLVPPFQRGWLNWLSKMVEPRPQERYSSAASALAVLKSIDVNRLPKVRLSRDVLRFTALEFGEKVTHSITVSNPIPETLLAGTWDVALHPNDVSHRDAHTWISFQPRRFEGNQVECKITVDTGKLWANQTYTRQILLHTNSTPDTYAIAICIQTAPHPEFQKPHYESLASLCFIFWFFSWLLAWIGNPLFPINFLLTPGLIAGLVAIDKVVTDVDANEKKVLLGTCIGVWGGVTFGAMFEPSFILVGSVIGALIGASRLTVLMTQCSQSVRLGMGIAGISIYTLAANFIISNSLNKFITLVIVPIFLSCLIAALTFRVVQPLMRSVVERQIEQGLLRKNAAFVALLSAGLGISLGIVIPVMTRVMNHVKWLEPLEIVVVGTLLITIIAGTSLPLINLIFVKRARLITKYRRSLAQLVKP